MSSTNAAANSGGSPWNTNLYDTKHDFVWKYGSDVVSLLAPQANERILDVGCGTGHLTSQIAEAGAHVLGVDRSPDMIASARLAYPNLKFEIADVLDLPFHTEFDAVFSNATLHWILEPAVAIRSIGKALRPGGRFVAEFGGKRNVLKMQTAFEVALVRMGVAKPGEVDPWYFPSVSEYSALLENNGFEVRLMTLFDRPTALADGAAGMRNWIVMFGADYLAKVEPARRDEFFRSVEDLLRPASFREGQWWGDYRRLRFVAFRAAE